MIRFDRVPEPADFDHRARVPGNAWLAATPVTTAPRISGPLCPGVENDPPFSDELRYGRVTPRTVLA